MSQIFPVPPARPRCRLTRLPVLGLVLLLAACTRLPDLDDTVPEGLQTAEYPALVPLEPVLGAPVAPRQAAAALEATLEQRRQRLRQRAQRLDRAVIDPQTQARMRAGVTR